MAVKLNANEVSLALAHCRAAPCGINCRVGNADERTDAAEPTAGLMEVAQRRASSWV